MSGFDSSWKDLPTVKYSSNKKNKKPIFEASDIIPSVNTAFAKAGSSIISLPETLSSLGSKYITDPILKKTGLLDKDFKRDYDNVIPYLPNFKEAEQKRSNLSYEFGGEEPKTVVGDFISKPIQYASEGGVFGKFPAVLGAVGGFMDSVGNQVQGEKTGLAGNILTQLGIGIKYRNPAQIQKIKETYTTLKKSGDLTEAKKVEELGKELGIDLTALESIKGTGSSLLDDVYQKTINSKKGKNVFSDFFKDRPDQIDKATDNFLISVYGGKNFVPQNITKKYVNVLEEVSSNTNVNKVARSIGYDEFDEIKDIGIVGKNVYDDIIKFSKSDVIKSDGKKLIEYANKVQKADKPTRLQGILEEIDDEISNLSNKLSSNTRSGSYVQELKSVRAILKNGLDQFESFSKASKFVKNTKKVIEKNYSEATSGNVSSVSKNADINLIKKVLSDPNVSPIQIKALAKRLNRYDKNLFNEMAGLLIEQQIKGVGRHGSYGAKIKKEVIGNRVKIENMTSIIEALAINQGKNPKQAVEGFKRFFNMLEGTSLPNQGSTTSGNLAFEESMQTILGKDVTKISTLPVANFFNELIVGNRYQELAKILTSDLDKFISIAKTPSKRTRQLIAISLFQLPNNVLNESGLNQ